MRSDRHHEEQLMPPFGLGFWYDRRSHRYHRIADHAADAVEHPRRYRSMAVANLNFLSDREAIIRHVVAKQFIRIRLWRDHLGFEFHGDQDDAFSTLRRFIKRHEVGPVVIVTFSDLSCNACVQFSVADVLAARKATDLGMPAIKGRRAP
jgi:hypothetical protein